SQPAFLVQKTTAMNTTFISSIFLPETPLVVQSPGRRPNVLGLALETENPPCTKSEERFALERLPLDQAQNNKPGGVVLLVNRENQQFSRFDFLSLSDDHFALTVKL